MVLAPTTMDELPLGRRVGIDGAELDEDPAGDTEVGSVELTEGREEG